MQHHIDAILQGGPAELPVSLRTHRVPAAEEKIKVPFYGGYEHFCRGGTVAGQPVVFHWTGRTRIAE